MKQNNKNPEKRKKQLNNYARYSGMAFQMLGIILLGVFGGIKLDELINWTFPVFTVVLTVAGVVGSIYLTIKEFL